MKLGIVMDPIQDIKINKDSSFAMLLAAQALGWEIFYMEIGDLFLAGNKPSAKMIKLQVEDNSKKWFEFQNELTAGLDSLDVILMRKDPPVDMEYIYVTQLLELAQKSGVLVVNNPVALREVNEKLFISWFPDYIAPTLVSRNGKQFADFIKEHKDIVLKPLDGMGGSSIFRVNQADANSGVIVETLTNKGSKFAMAQRYIPEISQGDKRILLIDGKPLPYALARIPKPGEHRGNLAAGGTGKGVELSARDQEICAVISPVLQKLGLLFTGIDVIGNYLTEINVTSPTCIRELNTIYNLDIARDLMLVIEKKYQSGNFQT